MVIFNIHFKTSPHGIWRVNCVTIFHGDEWNNWCIQFYMHTCSVETETTTWNKGTFFLTLPVIEKWGVCQVMTSCGDISWCVDSWIITLVNHEILWDISIAFRKCLWIRKCLVLSHTDSCDSILVFNKPVAATAGIKADSVVLCGSPDMLKSHSKCVWGRGTIKSNIFLNKNCQF